MRWARLLRAGGLAVALAAGGAYALASWDWCGRWGDDPPTPLRVLHGAGTLRAGAAATPMAVPFPVERAGYGFNHPTAGSTDRPLFVRALVLEQGSVRLGLVTVDLLMIPEPLREAIALSAGRAGLQDVVVVATHAHSSLGGYDGRLMSELAGTGRARVESERAILAAADQALREAAAKLAPVALEHATLQLGEQVVSRDEDTPEVDQRVDLFRLLSPAGPLAELTLLAAHPTLVPRELAQLSPDYPGAYAAAREKAHGGVALLVQGAVGNARAQPEEGGTDAAWEAFGGQLSRRVEAVAWRLEPPALAFARVRVSVPRPDSSRLVPALFRASGDNFLCTQAPRSAQVALLQLGRARLAFVPAEATWASGGVLEAASGATRVVSLADGYLGYLETADHLVAHRGESRRQYFGPALLDALAGGLKMASRALEAPPPR